ncbi:MAG: DUF465 domain-containing protein [Alphaproteobacteria bacterium]|nr:DUF465 domain-containing protein [Alphaproteobacteria bacterium]
MSLINRLNKLRTQHAKLESDIQHNINKPSSSDSDIALLKKQKLAVKDEIIQLEQQLAT